MRSVKPAPLRPQSIDVFVHPYLKASSHVFVHRDSMRRPLESLYDGPYKVIKRMDKFFFFKRGQDGTVNIDRLKLAYLEGNPVGLELSVPLNPQLAVFPLVLEEVNGAAKAIKASLQPPKETRSGRTVRLPEYLHTYTT
ncbi:unnamed protein product [Trichobilharzia regenti]|nr:unnamed protein product [Trichobilharzia regenti]